MCTVTYLSHYIHFMYVCCQLRRLSLTQFSDLYITAQLQMCYVLSTHISIMMLLCNVELHEMAVWFIIASTGSVRTSFISFTQIQFQFGLEDSLSYV